MHFPRTVKANFSPCYTCDPICVLVYEAFEIIHYVQSTDTIFKSRATNSTALVQVMDNDEANILVSDNALQLSEGGLPQVFEISRLSSQPLDTVQITITSTTDLILISPKNFSVSSQSWKGINKVISVRAHVDELWKIV